MRAPGGRRQVSDRHPTRAHAGRPNTTSGLVVWLVRHAEGVWNQAGLVQGQADAPGLTPSGAAHARALAEFLAGTGAAAVVSSDLRRAVETARPIAARLGATLVTDRRLRERNLGRLEGGPASLLGPGRPRRPTCRWRDPARALRPGRGLARGGAVVAAGPELRGRHPRRRPSRAAGPAVRSPARGDGGTVDPQRGGVAGRAGRCPTGVARCRRRGTPPRAQPYPGPMRKPAAVAEKAAAGFGSVDEVLALVRSRGGRATSSRRILLEVLFDSSDHLSVEELTAAVQDRAPDVHVSTIYRNLEDLQRLGVVVHSHLGHGPATYQLASLAHAHFVCERCGRRFEASDDLFRGLARAAKARLGFAINPHHFAIQGRCADCQAEPDDAAALDPSEPGRGSTWTGGREA